MLLDSKIFSCLVMETLLGFRRAGATIIITYFTPRVLDWLQNPINA